MKYIKDIKYLVKLMWQDCRYYFFAAFVGMLMPSISNLAQVVLPKRIIESLSASKIDSALSNAILMCLATLVATGISYWMDDIKNKNSGKFNITLSKRLAEAAASQNYQNFEDYKYREKLDFASACAKQGNIEDVIKYVSQIFGSVISLISLLYVISYVTWWLWAVMALSAIANICGEIYRAKYDYGKYREYEKVDMRMRYSRDKLTGNLFAKESRLFNLYSYVTKTAEKYINLLADFQKKRAGKTFVAYLASCLFDFLQRSAILGYIAYQCFTGKITIANFSMIALAILAISHLGSSIATDIIHITASGRYIDAYVEIINGAENNSGNIKNTVAFARINNLKKFAFTFSNVSFHYPGSSAKALDNISHTFISGKKYGLVGANGSGKTTYVSLLMRLYLPTSGKISYNGVNVNDFSEDSYRKLFSVVFQDFNSYAYTIGENVTMKDDSAQAGDRDKIFSALKKAGIEYVDTGNFLSSEYEQGIDLSGGELQKLAMARAFYKDAPVFIFDEPTAALSPKSEYDVYNHIRNEMEDKTVFFISHRLASCLVVYCAMK